MKFFAFLFFIPTIMFAQRTSQGFTLGVKSGIVFTETAGARINGFQKKSYEGGLTFRLLLSKKWTGQIEMLFVEKGSRFNGVPENGYIHNYILRFLYWEFPVLFQYHKQKWIYSFGPGFGFLLHSREFYYDG